MTQADLIRQFVCDNHVAPARAGGFREVTIRAGDVHKAMGLANAMPAVCSAIGSNKFAELAGVALAERRGPSNGANVFFRFSLAAHQLSRRPTMSRPWPAFKVATTVKDLDLVGSLVLVSCVKSKLPHRAPARSLYTSAWFRKARAIVEASGARWFVLSSRYGLVAPDAEIETYDYTLNGLPVGARRDWANNVMDDLLKEVVDERRIVMFAGQRYWEFLVEPLRRRGISVDVPMAHLKRGEQLAWLSENE